MVDLLKAEYAQTGNSSNLNSKGMREMQARAFEARNSQYLLLKAPPACGKSRAMMFLALDKLLNQDIRKVVVAVPEMSIGGSFRDTALTEHGFFADWSVEPHNNLCLPGGEPGKVDAFLRFMKHPTDKVIVCTHATLRFAFDRLQPEDFNGTLVGIDEFHHVSVDGENRLGNLIDDLMKQASAHIIAMTGSYFRGDSVPILQPEDEARFTKVTYSYYEQLNGYRHLKSLGIGYHFYTKRYIEALAEVFDTNKKTIIHIPNVNSGESTKDKYREVDAILDVIGTVISQDAKTGIISVKRADGRVLKVANLVDDNLTTRPWVVEYLRNVSSADGIDTIIALGMAKEGFDWPWCEHVLTVGYRSSMTEIIQIIGRATRDCEGKPHAQFTNLIAQPDAEDEDVKVSVNNMLKAITVSLLMEQVLAPNINFKPRSKLYDGEILAPGTIVIDDVSASVSAKVLDILNNDSDDLIAELIQKPQIGKSLCGGVEPEVINEIEVPKIIELHYPDLTEEEAEQVRVGLLIKVAVASSGGMIDESDLPPDALIVGETNGAYGQSVSPIAGGASMFPTRGASLSSDTPQVGNRKFVKLGDKFVNIENLTIDLIAQVNPFQGAYEILSKSVTAPMLKTIQDVIAGGRVTMSDEEAVILWPRVVAFRKEHDREPTLTANDPMEVRYAECLAHLKRRKIEKMQQAQKHI